MKKTHTFKLEKGDINKIKLTTLKSGNLKLSIYDGTGGNENDIIIQGYLTEDLCVKLSEALYQHVVFGHFDKDMIENIV